MTEPPTMNREEMLRFRHAMLLSEHRDLDAAIAALEGALSDNLALRRLKKRKLALKDTIARLEDELTPDIIA